MAVPLAIQPVNLLRSALVDAKVTGVVDLFTTDPTPFMPLFVVLHLRQVATFTSVPTISVGTNAPNYDNIIPASALTGLDIEGEYFRIPVGAALANGVFRGVAPASAVAIKMNVTVAAVAGTYNLEMDAIGAYD